MNREILVKQHRLLDFPKHLFLNHHHHHLRRCHQQFHHQQPQDIQ
jgi:hypothetical protein